MFTVHRALKFCAVLYLLVSPKIYGNPVLHLLKYIYILKQMQYRFAVTYRTLSTTVARDLPGLPLRLCAHKYENKKIVNSGNA